MRALTLKYLLIAVPFWGQSQIIVDNSISPGKMVTQFLVGKEVEIGQVDFIGMPKGLAVFQADSSIVGFESGLILSTGNTDSISGPNNYKGYTSWTGIPDKQLKRRIRKAGRDLNRLAKGRTTDVSSLEFEFVPKGNKLEFTFVFASEEYPEFVGSRYNDVFGFFISGPGIKKRKNLAVLPDGATTITVNEVNHKKNKQFYRSNDGVFKRLKFKSLRKRASRPNAKQKLVEKYENHLMSKIQFDGMTIELTAKCNVVPYRKYQIKLAIADVSDQIFDSAIFLKAGSFGSFLDPAMTIEEVQKKYSLSSVNTDTILVADSIPAESAPIEVDSKFEFTDILFNRDSFSIPDSSAIRILELSEYLKSNAGFRCELSGYTDNVGSKRYNQKLSQQRAESVQEELILNGVQASRIGIRGFDFQNPVSDNSTEQGRSKNRRVEIEVLAD